MKIQSYKWLLASIVAMSLSVISTSTEAHCKYVAGYTHNGVYHHPHKVCYHRDHHCKFIPSYTKHGRTYPAQKVCNYY